MAEPGDFDQASPVVQDLYFNKSVVSNPGYTQLLQRQIVEASSRLTPGGWMPKPRQGFGHEDKGVV
jgi:hypothetical protein